jgi:hypothetical protein
MEPWRLHDLRWTFSTRLHDAGVDPIVIEALLAHKQHVIILSFGGLGGPAIAQSDYPVRPIRLIVGYAAGGLTDVMTRMLGERMSRELGQPIVVENKPGAATVSPPLLSFYQHPTVILF